MIGFGVGIEFTASNHNYGDDILLIMGIEILFDES
jgi:hypothetical protein